MGFSLDGLLNAISEVAGVAKPIVEDGLAQKYEKAHQKRIAELQDILAIADGPSRADRLNAYILRLCADAGQPLVLQGDACISVPIGAFTAIVSEVSEGIKKDAIIASILQKS